MFHFAMKLVAVQPSFVNKLLIRILSSLVIGLLTNKKWLISAFVNLQQVKEIIAKTRKIKQAYDSTDFINNTFQTLLKLVDNSWKYRKLEQWRF